MEPLSTMYLTTIPNTKARYVYNKSSLNVEDISGTRSKFI
jgi:hypothetical protein